MPSRKPAHAPSSSGEVGEKAMGEKEKINLLKGNPLVVGSAVLFTVKNLLVEKGMLTNDEIKKGTAEILKMRLEDLDAMVEEL